MEAYRAAGDSTRFPELAREEGLAPWSPRKLYRSTRFDTTATTLVLEGGQVDRAVGLSYHQIAMAGRSLHRSQDMGRLQALGPSRVPLQLLDDRTGAGNDLFAGIDTTLAGAGALPAKAGGDLESLLAPSPALGRLVGAAGAAGPPRPGNPGRLGRGVRRAE